MFDYILFKTAFEIKKIKNPIINALVMFKILILHFTNKFNKHNLFKHSNS